MRTFNRIMMVIVCVTIIIAMNWKLFTVSGQNKKLPEGQSCSNTYDTSADHKCNCMDGMKCPMEKPKPCDDEEGNCDPPEHGPDSTKCISPYCKKDACKCADACKS